MPSGPGVVDDAVIAEVARATPPPIATFLLTSLTEASGIVEQQRRLRATTLQLVDWLEQGSLSDLRAALPGIGLVQVVHVTGPESVDEAVAAAEQADALLLDSGNLSLPVKELGGTGRRHDWRVSRKIVEQSPVPVFLAGGLRADNIAEAIHEVGPFGLDLCSGVRTEGALDERKLAAFFEAVDRA
jgi:phosphoribosylanthranilate isomerase